MALEDQHRDIFLSRGCRLDYNHITGFIRPAFEGMFRCEMLQIGNNLLLVSRLSRNTGDILEYLKNSVGIHISDILEVLRTVGSIVPKRASFRCRSHTA